MNGARARRALLAAAAGAPLLACGLALDGYSTALDSEKKEGGAGADGSPTTSGTGSSPGEAGGGDVDGGADDAAGVTTPDGGSCLRHVVGPNPGSATDSNGGFNTNTWSQPNSALVQDNIFAHALINEDESETLTVSGFGFALPANANVVGVTVSVVRAADENGVIDDTVTIGKGQSESTSRALTTNWAVGPAETVTYGGAFDTWGLTLPASDVNASSFGVRLVAKRTGGNLTTQARIDFVSVTVFYCQ